MRTSNDIVPKAQKKEIDCTQYTIINSSNAPISFICDDVQTNTITLLPDQMITDVYCFKPIVLDIDGSVKEDLYDYAWETVRDDKYIINKTYWLTSTWAAKGLDVEITVDVTGLVLANS